MQSASLVVCGFGAVGRATADALAAAYGVIHLAIIENDHVRAQAAQARGYRTFFADATEVNSLRVANVGAALCVFVCVSDASSSRIVRTVKAIAPQATVHVALCHSEREADVRAAGASNVVVVDHVAGAALARAALAIV